MEWQKININSPHIKKKNNVATFHLAPDFTKYFAFCAEVGIDSKEDCANPLVCHSAEEEDTREVEHEGSTSKDGTHLIPKDKSNGTTK